MGSGSTGAGDCPEIERMTGDLDQGVGEATLAGASVASAAELGEGEDRGLEGRRGDGVEEAVERQEATLAVDELETVALGTIDMLAEDGGGVVGMPAWVQSKPKRPTECSRASSRRTCSSKPPGLAAVLGSRWPESGSALPSPGTALPSPGGAPTSAPSAPSVAPPSRAWRSGHEPPGQAVRSGRSRSPQHPAHCDWTTTARPAPQRSRLWPRHSRTCGSCAGSSRSETPSRAPRTHQWSRRPRRQPRS